MEFQNVLCNIYDMTRSPDTFVSHGMLQYFGSRRGLITASVSLYAARVSTFVQRIVASGHDTKTRRVRQNVVPIHRYLDTEY